MHTLRLPLSLVAAALAGAVAATAVSLYLHPGSLPGAEAAAPSFRVRVEEVALDANSTAQLRVECPDGYRPTGGGYNLDGGVNGFLPIVYDNYPNAGAWVVRALNPRLARPLTLRGHALCIREGALP